MKTPDRLSYSRIYKRPNFRQLYDIYTRTQYDMFGEVTDGELLCDAKDEYDDEKFYSRIRIKALCIHGISIMTRSRRCKLSDVKSFVKTYPISYYSERIESGE